MSLVKCRVTGISSKVPDEDRHAFFVDLDGPQVAENPGAFRIFLRGIMHEWSLPVVFVLRTLKGWHVVSPATGTLDEVTRFHRAFDKWGADDDHRKFSLLRGYYVLRVTRKPGESKGQTLRANLRNPLGTRPLSQGHLSFYVTHFDADDTGLDDPAAPVDLETYDTQALVELERHGQTTLRQLA